MKLMFIGLVLAGFLTGTACPAEDTNRFLTFGPPEATTASSYSPERFQRIVDQAKTAPESRPAAEDPEGHWGAITEGLQLSVRFERDALLFAADEITNLDSLAAKLHNPLAQDGVSQYLWTNLSGETRALLAAYRGGADNNLAQALVNDLNRIIRGTNIYDANRFAGTNLSWNTKQDLLGRSGTFELNRSLLQDAYPSEFGHSQNLARGIFKVGEPVWAMVIIRNPTQAKVSYPEISAGWLDSEICQFEVLDDQQQPVPRLGSTDVRGLVSGGGVELMPGTQRRYLVLLNGRFDLRAPGHYTVQATKHMPTESRKLVDIKSGMAPLTIVP